MSPFSSVLLALRQRHDLRQSELAAMLGCDQSYISALEVGLKGPPAEQFVQSLIDTLQLESNEGQELLRASQASGRKLTIEVDAPQDVYVLMNELRQNLPRLRPATVQILIGVVRLAHEAAHACEPARRSARQLPQEAAMP